MDRESLENDCGTVDRKSRRGKSQKQGKGEGEREL